MSASEFVYGKILSNVILFFFTVWLKVKPAVAAVIHCDVSEMGSWMHPDVGKKNATVLPHYREKPYTDFSNVKVKTVEIVGKNCCSAITV